MLCVYVLCACEMHLCRKSRPRYEPVGRFAGCFDVCDIFLMYQHVMCRLYVGNSV